MPNAALAFIPELENEAAATRRVLAAVPADKLAFRPHAKSMTLGQLALHVARIPGDLASLAMLDGLDASSVNFEPPVPETAAELVGALDASIAQAKAILGDLDDARATQLWRLSVGEKEVFAVPRLGLLRSLMLNHWYHHRGQLTVYLRQLDVALPSVYGPSADENPFQG